jgi:ureidoacrylate peracid hydrolase
VVVDVQQDFWTDDAAATAPPMLERLAELISYARQTGIRVVHVRARFQADGSDWMARYRLRGSIPCIEGTTGAQSLAGAVELPGEHVVFKQSFDGFLGTDLDHHLRSTGVEFVLVAGLVTSTCVLFTAATATQLGYLVAVVTDCCSDREEAHRATLANYRFVFDSVRSDEIAARRDQWNVELDRASVKAN